MAQGPTTPAEEVRPRAGEEHSRRVLVIDEDRVEGGMLAFHLRREDLIVMLMAGEEEAVDALAWATPDAILTEVRGRELDGFRLLDNLGDVPVSVYLMSDGPLSLEDDLAALRAGVAEVFTKPLDPEQVARKIIDQPTPRRRGPVPELPDDGISGDLAFRSVTDLLTLCHRHRMNARLHVEVDGDWAVMLVRHGEVIDAESPGAAGREAVYAAMRRAQGTFVLFPLDLDAEELGRYDVVRADLATLFTEALGRPEPRPANVAAAAGGGVAARELPNRASPRGPLSRPTSRARPLAHPNTTLEYRAQPADEQLATATPRARIRKQVGIPATGIQERPRAARAKTPVQTQPERAAASANPAANLATEGLQEPGSKVSLALEEPRAPEPRAPEPRAPEPRAPEPRAPEPRALEPQALEPQALEPRALEPQARPEPAPSPEPTSQAPDPRDRAPSYARRRVPTGARVRDGGVRRPTRPVPVSTIAAPTDHEAAPARKPPTPPSSARVVRPSSAHTPSEPPLDEPTDVSAKNPLSGARVRRPTTGIFEFGDDAAPREPTNPDVAPIADDTQLLEPPPPARPVGRYRLAVYALAAALAAAVVFIALRLATKEAPAEPAPPPVAQLTAEERARVAFGKGAVALEAGKLQQAEALLTDLVHSDDRPTGALAGLAMIYRKGDRLAEAQQLLEALSRVREGDARVRAYLGLVIAEQGRAEEARGHFAAALKLAEPGALADRLRDLLLDGAR